jgi:hypothetical protein
MKNDNRDRSPSGRFTFLAEKRVGKAIMAISSVEKLSDRKNYEYTSEQSTQIIEALENSLEALKLGFAKTNHEAPKTFEFK